MYLRILKSSEIFPYKRLPSWQTLWFHNLSSTTFVDRWKQIDFSFPGWSIRSFHIYVEKTFGWCFDVVLTSLSHHVRVLILAKDSEPNFLLIFFTCHVFSLANGSIRYGLFHYPIRPSVTVSVKPLTQVDLKLGGRIQCGIPLNPHPDSPTQISPKRGCAYIQTAFFRLQSDPRGLFYSGS